MPFSIILLVYLVAVLLFAFGIRLLRRPDTARRGNTLSAVGMTIAIAAAFIEPTPLGNAAPHNNFIWIIGGIIIGAVIGWPIAQKVKMTAMPQLVAMFNGLGGASALVLALVEFFKVFQSGNTFKPTDLAILIAALVIGSISFTGSLIAFGKLQGFINKDQLFPFHSKFNFLFLAAILALAALMIINPAEVQTYLWWLAGLSLLYGFSFVMPIGGADMPVVISLLNSLTGLSAAAAGMAYGNKAMLIGGILVGASGTILTLVMCKGMNRTLWNVLFVGMGSGGKQAGADGVMKPISTDDAAILLQYSDSLMVVPGYGMAVAQAQKACKELDDVLSKNGVDVNYAIHPVAGRMPGHMNVLLAEADVPYDKLLDLDEANEKIGNTDVALIIGANDVVNPAAHEDNQSPIYGMPIINVLEAKHVIVMKRGRGVGYSGIQNRLFFDDKTKMYFGDAKKSLSELTSAVKTNL